MPRDSRLYMTFPNSFPWHKKITRLSVEARWAFVEMNGYSRVRDLDGIIPVVDAEFEWTLAVLAELVGSHPARPLVYLDGDNYVIREYAEHQQTTADRAKTAEDKSRAGKAGAAARWGNRDMAPAIHVPDNRLAENDQSTEYREQIEGYVSEVSLVSSEVETTSRPEIESLLDLLDSEIRGNGAKPPKRNKKNRDAMRLLLDKDGKTPEKVAAAIRWSQRHEFWRSVILSASSLRHSYDKLSLQAQAEREKKSARPSKDQQAMDVLAMGARLQQQEIEK